MRVRQHVARVRPRQLILVVPAERTEGGGLTLQVSLVLNSTFHARNRRRHYTQVVTKKSDTTEVEPGETRSWTSVRLGVPPYIPESRLDGCDMIDIAYELQVLIFVSSQGCSGAGTRGYGVRPLFSTGGRVPHSPHFLD